MPSRKSPVSDPSFQRAKATFDLRYYHWALAQARREINEDFPSLRLIKNELVYKFLEIARSMDKEEQLQFLSALVKRTHSDGVELAGDPFTARDQELIDRYLNHDYSEIAPGLPVLDGTFERRGDKRIYRSVNERATLPKIDKKRLRKLVVQKLRPILGECSMKESSDSWWYETKIGIWSVWTLVAAYKKFVHLSYFQRIVVQEGIDLRFPISPTAWFGIGGGSTDWKLWENSEMEEATDSMCLLVKQFLDAAPSLLEGIPAVHFS
jgi:hypothetical protein